MKGLRLVSLLLVLAGAARGDLPALPDECLVIGGVRSGGRTLLQSDAIALAMVNGSFSAPEEGTAVQLPDGTQRSWQRAEVGEDGLVRHDALRAGYCFMKIELAEARTLLLHARHHSMVYVNGAPRGGDPYGYGFVALPVHLRAGTNELLFSVGRGRVQVAFKEPPAAAFLQKADLTAPDLLTGEEVDTWAGVVVVNTREDWLPAGKIMTRIGDGPETINSFSGVGPSTIRKVPVRVRAAAPGDVEKLPLTLQLNDGDPLQVELRVRKPNQVHNRTFISNIDGSAQYYAVRPATRPGPDNALVLSLHGAGVEATGQAAAYGPHEWAHIVAATNRRKFGFDWEDWGRIDALEVLAEASARYPHDPLRVMLTGHSMGGHGTWQVGVLYPDRFAAIGPSAGWVSFWSYANKPKIDGEQRLPELMRRATSSSDTLSLSRNYGLHGVYVLHGDADDNVPVGQARRMKEELANWHPDFRYHEEPGAGHWWDGHPEPGAACVDWPPMFEMFQERRRRASAAADSFQFVTPNPAISADCYWLRIEQQLRPLIPSRVAVERGDGRLQITTENVAALSVAHAAMPSGTTGPLTIDGQPVRSNDGQPRTLYAAGSDGTWQRIDQLAPHARRAGFGGPFKLAFDNRFVAVVGTLGKQDNLRATYDKARYDAETFYYRGNAQFVMVPDSEWDAAHDGNVILYGNSQTNRAWQQVFGSSGPVNVVNGRAAVENTNFRGDNLACLLVRPRIASDGSASGLSAAVAGTGPTGMRLTQRLPYFVSGVGVPDFLILDEACLRAGLEGVRATGYFGNDWQVVDEEWTVGPSRE